MNIQRTPRTVACAFLALCALLLQTISGLGACILPTPGQQPFNPPIKEVIQPNPNTSYGLITLSNVPPGYTVTNGIYFGWCLDSFQQIAGGVPYCPVLYDSYDTASLTAAGIPTANLDKVNYILNHKPVGQATEVQLAIWHFIGGGGSSETDLETGNGPFPLPIPAVLNAIIADADANGAGFVPGPGQLTGVILDLPVSLNGLDPDTGLPFQRFLIEVTCPNPPNVTPPCVRSAFGDPLLTSHLGGHALWLPGIGIDYDFSPLPGSFVQNPDGTARITGAIVSRSNSANSFQVDLMLSGFTSTAPAGSPKKEMNASAYVENGGPINPATWSYYTGFTGTLTGLGSNSGARLNLVRVGPAFQIGVGANNKNTIFGASNWFNWTVVTQPTTGPALVATGQGDVNIDIYDCPTGTGRIGDFVWKDLDADGVQDAGEPGVNGVTVTLRDNNGVTLDITQTGPNPNVAGQNGYYQFTGLLAGTYKVLVNNAAATLAGCVPTSVNAPGITTDKDSNPNPATVILSTNTSSDQTIDFGYVTPTPSFALMKTVDKATVKPFESVTYTYTVKNTGATTLTDIQVTDDNATPGFAGDDFVVVSGLTLTGGTQQTFTLTKLPPLTTCATINSVNTVVGTLIVQRLPNLDYRMIYRQSLSLVDNTYGNNASPDWPGGHTFSNFTGSDKAQFRFTNGAGATVLDVNIDYLSSAATSLYPSGFGSLGATGGDGSVVTGSASNIASYSTTMTTNLNQSAAFYGFKTNSPAPPANFPTWDYVDGYTVVVKNATFGTSGFGNVSIPSVHNSPPKKGSNAVTPVPCTSVAKNTAKGTAKFGTTVLMAQADATVQIVVPPPMVTYTATQGGWGAPPNGNNVGTLLKNNFAAVYPGGSVTIGGTFTAKFTSASAIEVFLPSGGKPKALTKNYVNPTSITDGVLAGQVLALRLNVDFSTKGVTTPGLAALKLKSGKLAGQTVAQVLTLANSVLGGGALPAGLTITDINTAVTTINENFDGGTDKGNLIP